MTATEIMAAAPVATVIFLVTIGVSLWAFHRDPYLAERFMLHPHAVAFEGKYYQLFTHGLVHADYMHLGFNMITFWYFGFVLERIVGSADFAIIYIGSLLISGLVSTARKKHWEDYRSLGASGAISGVLFAMVLYFPDMELRIFFLLPLKGWLFAILFVGISYYAGKQQYSRIDHEGHLFGALAGAVLAIVLNPGVVGNFFSRLFG